MGIPLGSESPAILQLHKWGPSQSQLNLSEFREAFISPTRQLLLLLSYQCEALLLPLNTGDSVNSDGLEGSHDRSFKDPGSFFQASAVSSRSDSRDNMACTSGSDVDFDNDFSLEGESSTSNCCTFLGDVNSLAWGICGDTYNQHKDTSFRELLFVSGNHGVTVHAFCQTNRSSAMTRTDLEGDFGQGRWVEWGPSATVAQNMEVQEPATFCCKSPGNVVDVNIAQGSSEIRHNVSEVNGVDELSKTIAPKKWLQSFFTEVESIKSDGTTWTRFPDKSSFPCSAKVVSFSLFNSNLPLLDFNYKGTSISNKETVPDSENDTSMKSDLASSVSNSKSDLLSNIFGVGVNSLFKCSRVFSSNSHHLIGFFLTLVDTVSVNTNDESDRSICNNVLLVARLESWGIQWVSLVKLEESRNVGPVVEWMDFCFSDNLLVCLNASGLIFFYAAISGAYVAHIDVLQTCGLNPQSDLPEKEKFSVGADIQSKQVDEVHEKSTYQCGEVFSRRMFKRLLVASHTSLLSVVDEYGVIYVVHAGDYMPNDYYTSEKLLPHFQHLGLGLLVGWEVGGSDIGSQRVYPSYFGHLKSNISTTMDGRFPFMNNIGGNVLQKIRDLNLYGKRSHCDSYLSGFSAASKTTDQRFHDSEVPSHIMRKIFLSTYKFNDDDCIYFSPLGITRFIKKHHMKNQKGSQIVHFDLQAELAVRDDSCLSGCEMLYFQGIKEAFIGEAVGCTFQGSFYLVTEGGLSVVLPSISVSSNFLPIETIGYQQPSINTGIRYQVRDILEINESKQPWLWKLEVLDRVLLYESTEGADCLCLENGWDLKTSRMRRLEIALDYLKFDEIERSLEMLVGVNLAEEGILRLLFAAVHLMLCTSANENEVSAASRLLALATCFATKMIRKYGLLQNRENAYILQSFSRTRILSLPPVRPEKVQYDQGNSRRLREMAHFLEIIRNLQYRLNSKFKRPGQGLVDGRQASSVVDMDSTQDECHLSIISADADLSDVSDLVPQGGVLEKKVLPLENPKEMIARWRLDNLDLKTVVKDALLSGRLPLAVLQLHLHQSRGLVTDKEPIDTFTEVRDVGRAIAYDLFLKGETRLAVATLQRLGEDIETSLQQLLFGTVRRSLRAQIAVEMKKCGYLGPYEWKILDRISLIERLYPSSSFWKTFLDRQKEFLRTSSSSWTNVNQSSSVPVVDEDNAHAGYWAAAAIWSKPWDQRTIDRILLDQSFLMGVHVLWESQLEYHICHNDWEEVSKLLDLVPTSILSSRNLQVSLDSLQPPSTVGYNRESNDYGNYLCSLEELDAVCMDIPDVKIFRLSANIMCSIWLRLLMEEKLAKKFIFMKEYWEGTAEIVPLLARSGFITSGYKTPFEDDNIRCSLDLKFSDGGQTSHVDTVQALHKLLVHHCAQYNLPNLLDLYLDHHRLVLDNDSLCSLQEAAGDCQWARWLLLSRVKGREYDASLSNTRAIMSRNLVPGSNLSVLEIDEIIRTVDDIAEGGGELAALATLMYAPTPIQKCLSSGSVNRYSSSSAQCTLENLRPSLQRFPTLWRTLVAACFGHDTTYNVVGPKANNALSDYLNWRDNIFFSSGHDTSLLQMLPCWFPKAVRRLIQLYVQGPLGWQSLSGLPVGQSLLDRDMEFFINADEHVEIGAVSWEATIQKHVEEELYDSSLEETGLGLEHHLHRGRALAAFNQLLAARVQKFKSEEQLGASVHGQNNVQSDVQTLLAPLTQSEESLLASVMPLAIMHFEDSVLVASCTFLLELCGLSASMLRIDISALRRISSFYKSTEINENFRQLSPKGSAFHATSLESDITQSLSRALADDYLHQDSASKTKPKGTPNSVTSKRGSRALMLVLQHLEKASLPVMVEGNTCGSWLLSGNGNGTELRSQQKAASQHWNLVTVFCQMHRLPLSTKYLAVLARDNDWVGFLAEAQIGGYPFDTVLQVASKEFGDPRLRIHILTVLKGMQSRKKASSSSYSDSTEKGSETFFSDDNKCIPIELFRILAECEKQKNPGEALLMKAKDLSWSILAMIASCFPDVSPLSCLTVWLEITAARETSSIKVNDIASQIADHVGAAVEATNTLPAADRALTFHYNRCSPKRRRLIAPKSVDTAAAQASDISSTSISAKIYVAQGIIAEEERKVELGEHLKVSSDFDEGLISLSKMVAVLCEQHLFLPLLRAFEMFLPSCSLLPFIRALQAFSQMRLSEALAHLGSFSARIKEEPASVQTNIGREGQIGTSWISSTAIKAADAMLSTSPSPYEKRCLLQLLAATDFGDGGSAATHYRRLYWKINLAEPSLRKDDGLHLGNETLDDASLLTALEKNGHWEQARNWARQLEASGGSWKSVVHHVTETQAPRLPILSCDLYYEAESMVAEWKEFLWDVPEERVALWGHCQTLFIRYSFPALQAGLFFLKHAEAVEKDLPARELHELLLLSLQWLSGTITLSNPVCQLHLLREIETKVWLLAVESEAQMKSEGDFNLASYTQDSVIKNSSSIDRTARGSTKAKRRAKGYVPLRRAVVESVDKGTDSDDGFGPLKSGNDLPLQEDNFKMEMSFSRWEERVGPAELERAVLSLLEFGQISAAKQLQHKLSPAQVPPEFVLVDAALKLADVSTPSSEVSISTLEEEVRSVIKSYNIPTGQLKVDTLQVLESLATIFTEGSGRGICKRIIAVVKAANVLGLPFSEAFAKQPIELLQLLSLKAQESFEEANLLVQTHSMPAASIAQILAESFLKGLLAAHRGGYMDSQKEEGPAPLLWRFSDFLKWAELCPSEPEIGHALMRLVITGQEIPHACEVELLILSHHFYKSSACLDGVDVLVALAATRVESYVSEGDFSCLARLITGVGNFHALNFILGILIENGQLDLLLQKYSAAADTNASTAEAVRGFRMAVLTSLKQFNPNDLDAFAMVRICNHDFPDIPYEQFYLSKFSLKKLYSKLGFSVKILEQIPVYVHFDMKHETAALLESRAYQCSNQWLHQYDKDQNEDLLDSMRYYIEAAEVHSSIDAGNKTRKACAQASLLSLQIRMPDFQWLYLSETNARRALVEQSRFQEALIVAEAYSLNQPSEWALVLWNQMLKPELMEEFIAEFVAVLPLQPSMLAELARFYRSEVAARGDQSQFTVWLTGGGMPAEWAKYLGRSFRCLLKRTRDLRLRLQLASVATGFNDVLDACMKALDKVPDNAGPLVLRKGHGGAYLPLM
uniref:Spatacsin C-terminal domain-containing protein n=1 Tax=Fagus sylvatica TaxID=28930 RepID=A0A2N9FSI1_FAGSY